MKLWIRSQNKEILAIIKSLCYANHGGKNMVMGGEETTFDIVLGKYHTKERCLEIIDEIQELLKLGNPENAFMHIHNCDMGYEQALEVLKRARETKTIITQGADFDVKLPSVVVYQMPEK